MIEYTLTESKRKTLALYIIDNRVEVRVPFNTPKIDIDRFIASKIKWILKKLTESSKQAELRNKFTLNYGNCVTYRGQQYPISPGTGNQIMFDDTAFCIPPDLSPEEIKAACIQIYRTLAKRDLIAKVSDYAIQMGVNPAAIKINGAKTRWGSCSSKKSLNFSWRLIMADTDVVDYVVVHELSHIIEMNHSSKFYAIVKSVLPDYKERSQRLKKLQKKLNTEDWG